MIMMKDIDDDDDKDEDDNGKGEWLKGVRGVAMALDKAVLLLPPGRRR